MRLTKGHAGLRVFVVGLLAVAAVAGLAIEKSGLRMSGYNDAPVQIDVATVPAGARACQLGGAPWEGTRAVRVSGRVAGIAPAVMRAERQIGAAPPAVGRWTELRAGDRIVLPLSSSGRGDDGRERLCISNRGPSALVLSGVAVGPDAAVFVASRLGAGREGVGAGRFRVEGLVDDRPVSGWRVVDRIPERVAAGTGVSVAPWIAAGGSVLALLGTALLLSRRDGVGSAD